MKLISKVFAATALLLVVASCDGNVSKKHGGQWQQSTEATASSTKSLSDSSIVGKWDMTNAPEGGNVSFDFQGNGSFRLITTDMRNSEDNRTVSGQWSLKGTDLYLSVQGESEVIVMEVSSFDGSSMGFCIKGDKKINYFVRSN